MKPINLKEKQALVNDTWHPHRIAQVDDMHVLLARLKGEFIWHAHQEEDELFQVLEGTLYMQYRDRTEIVKEGEIIVVPKGVEHCPATKDDEEVLVMLFEKQSTAHTGEVMDARTKTQYPKI